MRHRITAMGARTLMKGRVMDRSRPAKRMLASRGLEIDVGLVYLQDSPTTFTDSTCIIGGRNTF
jgi:hypothetical protein